MPAPASDHPTTGPATPPRVDATAQSAGAGTSNNALGLLLRFISCGVLSIVAGLTWRLTLAPSRVGITSALLGILCLLSGFIVGGLCWYFHDARLRLRSPAGITDERLVFSFVVFAVVPFGVLVLVVAVWLLALLIGTR